MASRLTDLVPRPSMPAKVGKPVRVRANFFQVNRLPQGNLFHYDVQITPEAKSGLTQKIWKYFEENMAQQAFGGIRVIFDGRQNAFSPKKLPIKDVFQTYEVTLPSDGRVKETFKIRIKEAAEINMEELHSFLRGETKCTTNCLTAIMVLDVLIRYVPAITHTTIGRSMYISTDKRALPNGLEVWQGYYQSARPTQGKIMINIDVAATAFYESGPLSEIVAKILNRRSVDELRRGIPPRDLNKLERILKKVRLYSTHRGERRFKHTLHRFTPESADNTFFTTEDGGKVSVSKYFLQKYNKRLNYPFLPCVAVKDTVFLPMEVLEIIPGQRFNHKLNEKQTADMIKFTCQKPFQRANKIKQGLPLLEYQNPYMKDFNMEVSNDMAMINARVLSLPKISYNPSSQEALVTPTGGIWTLRGKKLLKGATLSSWSVVNFAGNVPKPALDRFFREIVSGFIDKGMNVTNRTPIMINADPQGNIETILKDAGSKAFKATKLAPQVIFCVVNNVNTALYPEIKRVSDTVIGVPTQCLQSKHIADANKQYCANVSLKVNVKLGGTNTCLPNGQIPFISQKPTIIFGADVTHPSPGDFARPSIAALTASMDAQASRYASTIRVQANRTEVIADLANMVKEMLRAFYSACGQKPQRMIFYRDGVSEGQFRQVMDEEVKAIKLACSTLEKSYDPALSFVAVQKRHHARFFPVDIKDADKTGNCMPGTVVDSDICHPTEFDFYLLSHPGLQGTCRPTHYHVLHDENNFSADSLQELTYRLCYTYARCTRAVSIVPAVYYADIIAARARYHRRGENWSDNAGTTAVTDPETMMSSFSPVHPQLQKIMYFM